MLIVIYALMLSLSLHSTIINIPADYSTIQAGINASADTDTVLVQPGTYVENIDFNGHLITLGSLFLTTADTSYISLTVIDGNADGSVITFQSGEDSTAVITGFTIQNGMIATMLIDGGGIQCDSSSPTISNNIIKDNIAEMGSGIHCFNSSAKIINNVIRNNSNIVGYSPPGGGIFCESSTDCLIMNNIIHDNVNMDGGGIACYLSNGIIINNNVFYNNLAQHLGGAIRFRQASATLSNNTFYDNDAIDGLCLYIENGCDITITNSIIWNHDVSNEDVIFLGHTSTFSIIYSNIEDCIWGGIGNIDEDPLFVDPDNDDFHLQENSPCIDAGDPNSPLDPDGTITDMGALYFNQGTSIENDELQITNYELSNYPNPFNPTTTISFSLNTENTEDTELIIYNLKGQKIKTFPVILSPESVFGKGQSSIVWDGTDQTGQPVSSGIYLYKLKCGRYSSTKKMILLK